MATGVNALHYHKEATLQVSVADLILLTKADLVNDEQSFAITNKLAGINPIAPRFNVHCISKNFKPWCII